MGFRGQKHRF